jgi:hypothetical protein
LSQVARHGHQPDPEDIFKCSYCEKDFYVSEDLRDHMNKHLGITFNCERCEFTTTTKSNLRHHVRFIHEEPRKLAPIPDSVREAVAGSNSNSNNPHEVMPGPSSSSVEEGTAQHS